MKAYRFDLSPARIFCVAMALTCMALIFMFSTENADDSTDTSGSVIEALLDLVKPDFRQMPADEQEALIFRWQHVVRKTAHFTINLALGFFVSGAVSHRKALSTGTAGAVGFCFLHACTDEFHQSFIPGRSGQFSDVLLDTFGACWGILISLGLLFLIHKRKTAPQ